MFDIKTEKHDEISTAEVPGQFVVLCKQCQFHLTSSDYAISIEGQHEHVQCNPQGYTFVFKCFSRVPGAILSGKPTQEFSWFSGYSWQYCHCQGCGQQLGWYFGNRSGETFSGLIAGKITVIEKPDTEQ